MTDGARQARLQSAVKDHGLPGATAAVARDGEIVWAGAAGFADLEQGRAMAPGNVMRVASITKMFTATAIFILRDEGALDLDDPVSKHVEEFPDPTRTIRHLLCHGSGLQRETPGDPGWRRGDFLMGNEFLAALSRSHLPFAPMQHFKYSNLAYGSLGEVVTRTSGIDYVDFVRGRIHKPLGLEASGFDPSEIPTELRTKGYLSVPDTDEVVEDEGAWRDIPRSMGGMHANVADLCRFISFLAGLVPGPLGEETLEELRYPAIPSDRDLNGAWALGPALTRHENTVLMGHAGGLFSFASLVLIDLTSGVSCAAIANVGDGGPMFPLVSELIAATEPGPRTPAGRPVPVPDEIRPLLGRYFGDGAVMTLAWRSGRLLADTSSPSGVPFPPPIEVRRNGEELEFRDGSYAGEVLVPEPAVDGKVPAFEVCTYRFVRI